MIPTQELKSFALFKGLTDKQLDKISGLCNQHTLEKGSLVFAQGKPAMELHLCKTGRVEITVQLREPWGIEIPVHTSGPGEVFGWSALVEPRLYTASAKCVEKTEDIYLKGSDLQEVFQKEPVIGYIVMTNLSTVISSRLTETRQKLAIEIANAKRKEW